MASILGYWDIRGIAEPIRFLLNHVGQEFEDKRYALGPTAETYKDSWLKEKTTLGFDFPNLPYYIDGDLKLTQSLAIMRHLARKHGLVAEGEQEKVRVDIAEQQGFDLQGAFVRLALNPDFEKLKEDYIKNLRGQFKELSKFLGDRPFLAGDKVTHVDFIIYEVLDQHLFLDPSCLDGLENLQDFKRRIEELPNIKKYRSSENFKEWPVFAHLFYFAGKGPNPRTKQS